jgi:glyoxylase-like metal-dependent hydrolase (beta-lactamase superfamily II)
MNRRTAFGVGTIVGIALIFACGRGTKPSELVQPKNWWEKLPRPVYATLEKTGTYQDWYEVYKLGEGTYAIYEPYQFEEALSYLVLGKDRGIIIDTGTGIGNSKEIVTALTTLPVMVINTHEHWDHIGGNHLFKDVAIYRNALAINKLIEGVSNTALLPNISKESLWKPLPAGFDPKTWSIPSQEPTYLLDNGTIIDLGGRTLEVLYTPGHSPGSICLLDKTNRILFTGDIFIPGPLYAYGTDVNIAEYRASIEKLKSRLSEYDYLCPGHNEPWVKSDVIPRVSDAFAAIFEGKGNFKEDKGLRRYTFEGFDIIIRSDMVK